MNSENSRFLEEGIKHYEEARDTVSAFEKYWENRPITRGCGWKVFKRWEYIMKNRENWRPLNEAKIGRITFTNRNSKYGYWIAIEITGKSPRGEKAIIDCGLWWKCPKVEKPIIYANYYYEPKRVTDFAWKKRGSEIDSFTEWQRTFLHLPLRKATDIEEGLNSLLTALLKQLA